MLLTTQYKKANPITPKATRALSTKFFLFVSAIARHEIIKIVGSMIFVRKKRLNPTCANNGLSSTAPKDKPISVVNKSPALVRSTKIPRKYGRFFINIHSPSYANSSNIWILGKSHRVLL